MKLKKAESMSAKLMIALRQQPGCLPRFLGPFWPATVMTGLLAFTRDREGILAAMRLDTYTRALPQAAAPEAYREASGVAT